MRSRIVAVVSALAVVVGLFVGTAPASGAGAWYPESCVAAPGTYAPGDSVTVTAQGTTKGALSNGIRILAGGGTVAEQTWLDFNGSTSHTLSTTIRADQLSSAGCIFGAGSPGTYVFNGWTPIPVTDGGVVVQNPAPKPAVTCTSSPAAPFAGEPFTVTGSVTNAADFDTSAVTVTESGGTPQASPLSVTAPWTPTTLSYTCEGTGTKNGTTKTASASTTVQVQPRVLACSVNQPDPYEPDLEVSWTWQGPSTDRVDVYLNNAIQAQVLAPGLSTLVKGLNNGTTYNFRLLGAQVNGFDPQISASCSGTVSLTSPPAASTISPTGPVTFGALSLNGQKAVQAFTIPMPAAPAGWKYAWQGPGTTNGSLPSFAPCSAQTAFTPTLVRDRNSPLPPGAPSHLYTM